MAKTMIFTVQTIENDKPIVYAQLVDDTFKNDQKLAESLIHEWAKHNIYERNQIKFELEDLAYKMRKEGYAWWDDRYCFELTEV